MWSLVRAEQEFGWEMNLVILASWSLCRLLFPQALCLLVQHLAGWRVLDINPLAMARVGLSSCFSEVLRSPQIPQMNRCPSAFPLCNTN